jgi:hypothetical protein
VATPTCAVAPAAVPSAPADVRAVDALRRRCEVVITGELARLARRSPTLGAGELEMVSTSIRRVVERLLLERVRGRSPDHLVALFGLEET